MKQLSLLPWSLMVLASLATPVNTLAVELVWTDGIGQILKGTVGDSSSVTTLYDINDYPGSPSFIAPLGVDVDDGFVYWADSGTGQVLRGSLDGSGSAELLFDVTDYPVLEQISTAFPTGLAVENGLVYWTDDNRIFRGASDGSGTAAEIFDGFPGFNLPSDLAIDGDLLFWTDFRAGRVEFRTIVGDPFMRGTLFDINDYPDNPPPIGPFGISVSGDDIFWTDSGTRDIRSGARDGSGTADVIVDINHYLGSPEEILPFDVVYDRGFLYWTDIVTDQILRKSADGNGPATIVFDKNDYPDLLADIFPAFIVVVESQPGDYDGDGDVDGDDFLEWQSGFGITTGALQTDGDADEDGDVDGSDFLIWQRSFGANISAGASAAIPEPTTFSLLLIGCMAFSSRPRRYRDVLSQRCL